MEWDRIGPDLDVRPLFPVERGLLLDLLSGLSRAQWDAPSPCAGWSVHDVVAHLAHDYLRRLSNHRDGRPWAPPRPGEPLPALIDRVNGEFVAVARQFSPRVLVDVLAVFGEQLDDLWAGCDLQALGTPVWWAADDEPAPVWLDVAREYTEFWVHQQHVRDAVGRPGADSCELVSPVVDTFLRALPRTLRHVPAVDGTRIALTVSAPVDAVWLVTRDRAGWRVSPVGADERPPAAAVALSPDTLWRAATGAISPQQARGRSRVEGDETLALAVLHLVSIIR